MTAARRFDILFLTKDKGVRRMRRWLAWMLVLVFCLGSAAMAEGTGFLFRNGVTWASTPEEVRQSESAAGSEDNYKEWTKQIYYQAAVSRFVAELTYAFRDDQLYFCGYWFYDSSAEDREYLAKALSSKYGDPTDPDPETLRMLMCLLAPVEVELLDIQNWRLADGTYIAMFCMGDREECNLVYFNEEKLLELAGMYNTYGL